MKINKTKINIIQVKKINKIKALIFDFSQKENKTQEESSGKKYFEKYYEKIYTIIL